MKRQTPIRPLMFVHIAKDLGDCMSHFENDCDAIIEGVSGNEYSVYLLKNGKICNTVAWYHRSQLTPLKKQSIKEVYRLLDLYEWLNDKLDECDEKCGDYYNEYKKMAEKVWSEYYSK